MSGRVGPRGEEAAAGYLRGEGYEILQRNYRFGRGEIDIIARKDGTIVFVEVKSRSSGRYGEPEEAVDREKVRRLRRLAAAYLAQRRMADCDCRFDVVAVLFGEEGPVVRHTVDIFS